MSAAVLALACAACSESEETTAVSYDQAVDDPENSAQATMPDDPSVEGAAQPAPAVTDTVAAPALDIMPIEHATMVLSWAEGAVYVDPVGGEQAFAAAPAPTLVLVTDIHSDHMDADTLEAVLADGVPLIAPQAVIDELPEALASRATVLANGDTTEQAGISVEAVAMYNLPEADDAFHPKGRGNGYVLEMDGTRVYIAGDTEDVPEMRALEDIDVAFIPMNLPYTMTVEDAADGVLAFAPDVVYPYHFRGQDGYSDVERFRTLVEDGSDDIDVQMLEWYPQRDSGNGG